MDLQAIKPGPSSTPIVGRAINRLMKDYARLSSDSRRIRRLARSSGSHAKTEPNYSTDKLRAIDGPKIMIADGDHGELIKLEHTIFLTENIPSTGLDIFSRVSNFVHLQDHAAFNRSKIDFLDGQMLL